MNVEFECPSCQQKLVADVSSNGGQVTCPACASAFNIDASCVELPTVKARAVPVAAQQVSSPQPGPAVPRPVPRPGIPPRTASAPVRPAAAKSFGGSELAIFGGLAIAVLGIGGAIWYAASKTEEKPSLPSKVELAKVQMGDWAAKEAERVKHEAEQRAAAVEKNRQEIARRYADDQRRIEMEREARLTDIAERHFNGDRNAAAALLREAEYVNEEIQALFADNITGNEPQTRQEYQELWHRMLNQRIQSNPTISRALAGRSAGELARQAPGDAGFGKNGELLGKYNSFGSGFFVSSDGWIITNRHVVGNANDVDVRTTDGTIHPAKVIARDETKDLALLKIAAKTSSWLKVSQGAKELELGDSVFTIGFPNPLMQGVEPKYTDGRVSSQSGMRDDKDFYQVSVPVQPGNSGGPLIDMASGWAVGVITARLDRTSDGRAADNVSYALKGSTLRKFIATHSEADRAVQATAQDKAPDSAGVINRAKGSAVSVLIPQ